MKGKGGGQGWKGEGSSGGAECQIKLDGLDSSSLIVKMTVVQSHILYVMTTIQET